MKAFTEVKVSMVAVNILDMAETNNGDHTVIITDTDLDLEVDKFVLHLYTHCT